MRKLLTLTIIGLVGCAPSAQSIDPPKPYEVGQYRYGVYPWEDPMTGCQYLYTQVNSGGVLTPRLGSDGRPFCVAPGQKLPQ